MIQIEQMRKVYRTEEVETIALDNMKLHIREGEFVAIMGPSGCGKSTLLNIMGLLDEPTSGSYRLNGLDTCHLTENEQTLLRKETISFVFQNYNLIDELTAYENVELPLEYSDVKYSEWKGRVEEALRIVNLSHRRNHFPTQLSGGQQQRVAIARALVTRPRLILADEPTGNLDSNNSTEIMDILSQLNNAGTTIVMVTHSEHDARYCHRVIHILDGKPVTENFLKEIIYTVK